MKKLKIVGVISLCVLILALSTFSIISYHAGNIAEANYDLMWAVALSFPFYNAMSSEDDYR